jgi:PAS domain S-box-containing protein
MAEPTGPVRFREVIDNVPDLVTLLDGTGTVRYASPALSRIVGYPAEAMIGRTIFEFVHPDDLSHARAVFGRAVEAPGIMPPVEVRFRHRDGSWRVVEALGQTFLDGSGVARCVVSSRDLTERARRRQNREAETPVASGVAYEFNNLLTIIIARSDLVLGRLPSDDEIRRNVNLIQRSAQRAAELLQPLLTGDEAAPATPAAEASRSEADALRGSETILLVDDEDAIRRLLTETLSMGGYTVLEARHGADALDVCARYDGPIHVMVTDVVMPQMSGQELVQRVRPVRPDMKVVYVSGYTDIPITQRGVIEGDSAFLPKPFMPHALTRKIREVLDRPAVL